MSRISLAFEVSNEYMIAQKFISLIYFFLIITSESELFKGGEIKLLSMKK